MSLFRIFFDNDFWQRSDINRLEHRAESLEAQLDGARDKDRDLKGQVADLNRELSRVALVVEALVRALKQKSVCTQEELAQILTEVDLQDGVLDGKVGEPPDPDIAICACGRKVKRSAKQCMYCGAPPGWGA